MVVVVSPRSEVRFRFGSAERPTFIGGLRHAQIAFLVVSVASAVVFLRVVGGHVGVGIAATLLSAGVSMAFGTIAGRPFDDWVPAASRWSLLVLTGNKRWRSVAPTTGERGRRRTRKKRAPGAATQRAGKPSPPPPVRDWQLIYTTVAGQPLGVLRDRKRKAWVAVLAVRGESFLLLDETEKTRRLGSWAAIEASMARQGSPIARFAWLERTLPEIGDEMRTHFNTRATASGDARDSYAELLDEAQPVTQQHETFLVIAISANKAGRAIRNAGGGDKGAVAVLYRELGHLTNQLRDAGLSTLGFLSGDRLATLLRTQFDPGVALGLAAKAKASKDPVVSARAAWPMACETAWGHYRTDEVMHITYWVQEWPRLGVSPSFLSPLLLGMNGVTRTVALVAEPIPTSRAVKEIEHAQTARMADDDMRQRAGYRTSARRHREAEALDRREAELADGHAECRYSGYVTISGTSLAEVEEHAAAIEQIAYQCPIELRRLWGEQDTAFYATLPFTLGLRS